MTRIWITHSLACSDCTALFTLYGGWETRPTAFTKNTLEANDKELQGIFQCNLESKNAMNDDINLIATMIHNRGDDDGFMVEDGGGDGESEDFLQGVAKVGLVSGDL